MNSNLPLVSVCLPVYNGEKYLLEALISLKLQTYQNIELIVSDDNSSDNSLKIIDTFKTEVSFPIYVFDHKPKGIGANWNNCANKANGDYIKFLFQDDILSPTCIEKMVKYALKNKNIGLVYSKRDFIYNAANEKNIEWIKLYNNLHLSWKQHSVLDGVVSSGKQLLKDDNIFEFPENKIGEPTAVLIKKEVFRKVGPFSEVLKQTLDIEYWCRVMKYYDVIFIDEKLISFRLHDKQATAINAGNNLREINLFYQMILGNLFWQLNKNVKKTLFLKYTFAGRVIKKILYLIKC
ncbi:glycosyltransferase [Flavobacterium aquidurense]|uniref:glycosyltransferase family 2 protein n=1 Tax=Flavobacterium aquidurense TaxID=362413 RepID=UPI002857CB6E|nr:glycosyltransferase [Flavobacterium aquidurense]MDR7372329.1 glycosyltransferase involved in cell wall biosynthesis [Flavobacterium aquidurense]